MRILKSMPGNRDFFNEHGRSLAAYGLIGLIGQTLSGLSLAYAVFALIVQQTGAKGTPTPLLALAVTVGLFVELANRVLARPAIRPYVVRDQFADAPELQQRHKILNRSYLVGLIAVALLSYVLSAVGSTYYAEDANEGPQLVNVDSLNQVYEAQRNDLSTTFAADTAMIAGPYNLRLEAAQSRFKADSLALMKDRTRYQACARQGNAWCKGKLTSYLADIDRSRAALADTVATIAREKSQALAAALTSRKDAADQLQRSRESEIQSAQQTNDGLTAEHEKETGFQGLIFMILTVAGQTVFYFMVYLTLQVEAGAEIEHELEPNEFWNLPSTLAELKTTIAWRLERGTRRAIRWIFPEPKERPTGIPYRSLYATTQGTPNGNGATQQRSVHARARTQAVTQPQTDNEPQTERERKPGEVGNIEQCEHCGNDYVRKTTRQRFCSTNCRLEHHAAKHNGRRFDAVMKRKQ